MVVLKKIKASTLVETITASTIIIIVFTIAMFTINNVFISTVKNDKSQIKNHLKKLEYQYLKKQIKLPFYQDFEKWEVSVKNLEEKAIKWVEFKAENTETKKTVVYRKIYVEE